MHESANPPEIEALFPEGTVPEVRFCKPSSLRSFGFTPLVVTGAIRQTLLQHFAEPAQVISASLRAYLEREGAWTEGETTGLYIEALSKWRPELTEARPSLVIKENDWTWTRLGIGDRAGADYRSGTEFFAGLWYGSHTVFALGKEGAETQILASEVAKTLLWYATKIEDSFELARFLPLQIGALSALEESTEHYAVPVNIAVAAWENWSLTEEAPRLKNIEFRRSQFNC